STIVVMLLSLIIVSLCICLIDKDFVWKAWNSLPVIFILWFLVYIVIALLFIAVDKKINTFRLVIPYVFLLFTYGAYNISCRAWRYNNLIWTDYIFNSYRCKGPDYVQIFKITDTINNLYNKRPLPVDNSLKDSTITSKTDSTKSNKTLKGK
ncbi:MAG: hypothetical protein JWN78_600, partial [Bacteroidota bacterium]|nr:hypothetical protein [Bacteroidota bacterium]